MSNRDSLSRIPRVPIDRRAYAFLIDYIAVWLVTLMLGGGFWLLQLLVFTLAWLGLRVILVEVNQGQSLGRWALDLKIIDLRYRKIPGLLVLTKREAILGAAAFLAMLGLNINFGNAISMLILISPLAGDCCLAIADEQFNQALHDRVAQTLIIPSRRGFSLDLRSRRLIWEIKKAWRNRK